MDRVEIEELHSIYQHQCRCLRAENKRLKQVLVFVRDKTAGMIERWDETLATSTNLSGARPSLTYRQVKDIYDCAQAILDD